MHKIRASCAFQLTPSRRATTRQFIDASRQAFQLTPSRRATALTLINTYEDNISTHALTEGDQYKRKNGRIRTISTHALTEGDNKVTSFFFGEEYFNSRPHGGRQWHECYSIPVDYFNSRPHGGRRHFASLMHLF